MLKYEFKHSKSLKDFELVYTHPNDFATNNNLLAVESANNASTIRPLIDIDYFIKVLQEIQSYNCTHFDITNCLDGDGYIFGYTVSGFLVTEKSE